MITVTPFYNDRTKDLLAAILLSLGGNMQDVKPLYNDTKDDLLYAILEKLGDFFANNPFSFVAKFTVGVTNNNRQTLNFPSIINASGVVVSVGGFFLDDQETELNRYFLADTVSGDIDLPPMGEGETVLILKY